MSKKDVTRFAYTVFCCDGGDCREAGSREVLKALRQNVRAAGLKERVHFIRTECTGQCKQAPVAIVCGGCKFSEGLACGAVWYRKLSEKGALSIVEEHLAGDRPVVAKMFRPREEE